MTSEAEKLLGRDLKLGDRAGGLDVLPSNQRDIDVAAGYDNMIQALTLRLRIRKGELAALGWPNYGSRLHELIGAPNQTSTHIKLMAYARTALEQDPRVAAVSDIQTQVLPGERDTVRLYLEIELIDQPNPFNLVFDFNLEAA
ncbi:MAG: GPW/gp25 family protein [Cyanothece sp. SIO1E1]|nr:GPW/gp25 family protein [Cyanothece sp. SIO1E1]